ncbi:MAG: FAD-binding oxidoreductase [Chloroflexota bacterium]
MSVRSSLSLNDLQRIVGHDAARAAESGDSVDGVQPSYIVEPATAEQTAEIMTVAHGLHLAVIPRGAGTKMGWGNFPARADIVVCTRRMDRVLEHASGDLVARVQAGTTLESVQRVLGERGQWLALDPPERGATIGGIIAANAFGPRRFRYGGVRDLLIGFTYVLSDGTIARAGGKVVKNVAGYDLGKLFCGSLGTLGLIVEATFRLHPQPAARAALTVEFEQARSATIGDAVQHILNSTLVPSQIVFAVERHTSLSLLFEGVERGVEAQLRVARDRLQKFGKAYTEAPAGFPEFGHVAPPGDVDDRGAFAHLRVTATLAGLSAVLDQVRACAPRRTGVTIRGYAAPPTAYVTYGGEVSEVVDAVKALRHNLAPFESHVVIQRATREVKDLMDAWGDGGDALPMMRRVKELFDPDGTMNPGRFVGGI